MSDETFGHRDHFKFIVGSTDPVFLGGGGRLSIYIINEGTPSIRVCNVSGSVSALGTLVPSGGSLLDSFSDDDYWALAVSSSGTVSGFIVRE